MAQMGFKELVPAKDAGIIITAFLCPKDDNFSFEEFSQKLAERGSFINLNMFAVRINPIFLEQIR
jgi:hypothetical protein